MKSWCLWWADWAGCHIESLWFFKRFWVTLPPHRAPAGHGESLRRLPPRASGRARSAAKRSAIGVAARLLPGRGPAPALGCLAGVCLAGAAEPLIHDHGSCRECTTRGTRSHGREDRDSEIGCCAKVRALGARPGGAGTAGRVLPCWLAQPEGSGSASRRWHPTPMPPPPTPVVDSRFGRRQLRHRCLQTQRLLPQL